MGSPMVPTHLTLSDLERSKLKLVTKSLKSYILYKSLITCPVMENEQQLMEI